MAFRSSVALLFLLLSSEISPALGQVEEIIVTATKRPTTIQTTSASVNAFTGEEMSFRSVDGAQDLAFRIPGLVYGEASARPTDAFART